MIKEKETFDDDSREHFFTKTTGNQKRHLLSKNAERYLIQ